MRLEDHWQKLNISLCLHLESLATSIDLIVERPPSKALSHVVGLLSEAPPSLRTLSLEIIGLAYPTVTRVNREILKLQAFDEIITKERFPVFQKFELVIPTDVMPSRQWQCQTDCTEAAYNVLPQLRSWGVMKISVR